MILIFPCDKSLTLEDYVRRHCTERKDTDESENAAKRKKTDVPNAAADSDQDSSLNSKNASLKENPNRVEKNCVDDCSNSTKLEDQNRVVKVDGEDTDEKGLKSGEGGLILERSGDLKANEQTLKRTVSDMDGSDTKTYVNDKIERVVFIDSTWHQVHKIASDERLKGNGAIF